MIANLLSGLILSVAVSFGVCFVLENLMLSRFDRIISLTFFRVLFMLTAGGAVYGLSIILSLSGPILASMLIIAVLIAWRMAEFAMKDWNRLYRDDPA